MTHEKKVSHLWEQYDGRFKIPDIEAFVQDVFTDSCSPHWAEVVWIGRKDEPRTETGYLLVFFDSVDSIPATLCSQEKQGVQIDVVIEDIKWNGCSHYTPHELIGESDSADVGRIDAVMQATSIQHIGLVLLNVENTD